MKSSVVFPQIDFAGDPVAIKEYIQVVESLGYDGLHVPDMLLGASPNRSIEERGRYSNEDRHHEPFVLFGYLAGLTSKLEFVSGVTVLPQRPTVLVAKQAAEVDFLSSGRFRLGVGVGESRLETRALGYQYSSRGKRIEEQVHVLRELWTKPIVTFMGKYHQIDGLGLNPLPVQRPIPIWFGGAADIVLRRMARLGDGWMLNATHPEDAVEPIEKLGQYLRDAGREMEEFGIDIRVNLSKHPRRSWGDLVAKWRELPITHIGVNTMGSGFKHPQEHIDAIRLFKEETGL